MACDTKVTQPIAEHPQADRAPGERQEERVHRQEWGFAA